MQAIHDRVLALGFETCSVDLFSVDSQFSQESPNAPRGVPDPRGVMVLVTGQLTFQVRGVYQMLSTRGLLRSGSSRAGAVRWCRQVSGCEVHMTSSAGMLRQLWH